MNHFQALSLVREYVDNENLVRHMLAVEAAMRFYAVKFDQDQEVWGVTGLLHDFDWEIHPTLEQHPQQGASIYKRAAFPMRSSELSSAMPIIPVCRARRLWKNA